jgi:hypothetical protein
MGCFQVMEFLNSFNLTAIVFKLSDSFRLGCIGFAHECLGGCASHGTLKLELGSLLPYVRLKLTK